MSERIVSMHAAHRSGKEVVDGFLSRPSIGGERPAVVLVHGYRGLDDGQRVVTRRFAHAGADHAFLNNPSSKIAANRGAAEKSVVTTTKWLKKTLA